MLLPALVVLIQPWLKAELNKMLDIIKKKMEENFNWRSASYNDSPPAQVPQCHPGMRWQPDYLPSQGDPALCPKNF